MCAAMMSGVCVCHLSQDLLMIFIYVYLMDYIHMYTYNNFLYTVSNTTIISITVIFSPLLSKLI